MDIDIGVQKSEQNYVQPPPELVLRDTFVAAKKLQTPWEQKRKPQWPINAIIIIRPSHQLIPTSKKINTCI